MGNPCLADRLDTVLEVPVPDLHHAPPPSLRGGRRRRRRRRIRTVIKAWVRSHLGPLRQHVGAPPSPADVQLMLLVIGAPLLPQAVEPWKGMAGQDIRELPLEVSKAKYVVEQYVAAAGGAPALAAAASMCAVGNVWMRISKGRNTNCFKAGVLRGEVAAGGFVLWQKRPELWCVELLVAGSSGAKMSAGSDGKVSWRQAPWQPARAAPGPSRLLRRCVQGLDPKSTADLFSNAAWAGEKRVDGDDCFVLRVDGAPPARSRAGVEVVRQALMGYFSQRTGLLVGLEDTHLVRVEGACWETSMASSIGDYRRVDGVSVAHAGRTFARLTRFDAGGCGGMRGRRRTRTWMEEAWSIEEVGFNVVGLCTECFLPPRDMVPCDSEPVAPAEKECVTDGSGEKNAAASSPKSAVGNAACNVAAPDEVMGKIGGDVVRPAAVARKLLVPATAARGLVWLGLVKVAAVGTVDVAEASKAVCTAV